MIVPSTASEQLSGRAFSKSPGAFRTIAEVASELDLPAHVLRFWESKFPQIKPLKRRGGRRYYRPEDVALLRRIRSLLYTEGYTIKGVQRLLREGGAKAPEQPAEEAAVIPDRQQAVSDPGAAAKQSRNGLRKEELRAVLSELQAIRVLLGGSKL
jgi:DNA-binding transcriptional MerR regulator